jgi:AcrR family transcriptional regulator
MDAHLLWRRRGRFVAATVKRAPRRPVLARSDQFLAPPRQARSHEKRASLMAAARALFGRKGYEATSIGDITSSANAAAGAFYTYFRSKQQLLVVLMDELIDRLSGVNITPGASSTTPEGLRDFLADVFRVDLEYYGVIRAWQEATLTDPELARLQRQIEAWTSRRILEVFQRLRATPNARKDTDLPTFARMMDRHFWSLLARRGSISQRDFNREIDVAADVIHRYLFR